MADKLVSVSKNGYKTLSQIIKQNHCQNFMDQWSVQEEIKKTQMPINDNLNAKIYEFQISENEAYLSANSIFILIFTYISLS